MTEGWAKGWVFAGGLALGAVAAVAVYLHWFAPPAQPANGGGNSPEARQLLLPEPVAAGASSPSSLPIAAASCPFEPALARGSTRDGQFALRAALVTNTSTDPSGFLAAAKEAMAQGRQRDAEVALIMACRVAGHASGAPTTPLADIKSQLAQHYASMVSRESATERRRELLRRAELLYVESVRTYSLALGKHASKTRLATQGLETVTQAAAMETAGAPDLGPAPAGREPPAPSSHVMPSTDSATGDATAAADDIAGSVDAVPPAGENGAAGSASQRLISADPELADLELDLARLHSQAQAVSRDFAEFQRRQQQALAQRESKCRDKACLLDWYARRKRQLIDEF
jgi:hypothetical protein